MQFLPEKYLVFDLHETIMFILPWLEIIRDIFHKNEFPIFININYLSGDKHFEGVFDIIK